MLRGRNGLTNILRRTGLKRRLTGGMLLVSILPATILFTIMSASFYASITREYENRAVQTASELQSRAEQLIDTVRQRINGFASGTETVKALRRLAHSDNPVERSSLCGALRNSILEDINRGTSHMRVELLDRNGAYVTGIFDNYFSGLTAQARASAVESGQRMTLWCGRTDGASVLVFSREIINFYSGRRIGWVLAYLDAGLLEAEMGRIRTEDTMALYDAGGTLICAAGGAQGSRPSEETLRGAGVPAAALRGAEPWSAIRGYRVLRSGSEALGWSTAVFLSAAELDRLILRLALTAGSVYLLALGAVIFASLAITRTITQPVGALERSMQRFSTGLLSTRVEEEGEDELTVLALKFNAMASSIEHLTKDVYEAKLKEKEATLRALEAQINPHFLYNTLDMVNWMAFRSDNQDVCRIVRSLSSFFRLSLNRGRELYTVADELKHVQSYITIEEYARTDVTFLVSADENVLLCECPKLIVQPLVENALIHGIEPNRNRGRVEVAFAREGQEIVITVEDNGVGLPQGPLPRTESDGYGLDNIAQRLRMLYGEAGRVTLTGGSALGGAAASVRFPMRPSNRQEEGTWRS